MISLFLFLNFLKKRFYTNFLKKGDGKMVDFIKPIN